jgi:hypothetical protein
MPKYGVCNTCFRHFDPSSPQIAAAPITGESVYGAVWRCNLADGVKTFTLPKMIFEMCAYFCTILIDFFADLIEDAEKGEQCEP